jgi:hypothetical protein
LKDESYGIFLGWLGCGLFLLFWLRVGWVDFVVLVAGWVGYGLVLFFGYGFFGCGLVLVFLVTVFLGWGLPI